MSVLRARRADFGDREVSASAIRSGSVDPHELFDQGYRKVIVREPVPLGFDLLGDAVVLRTLADAASATLDVRWRYSGSLPWPTRTFVHLQPPESGPDSVELAWWRASHQERQCCYRVGPDFLILTDGRPGGDSLRVTISGPSEVNLRNLLRSRGAIPVGQLDDETARVLAEMQKFGLAVDVGGSGRVLLLPYHLRSWPILYAAG